MGLEWTNDTLPATATIRIVSDHRGEVEPMSRTAMDFWLPKLGPTSFALMIVFRDMAMKADVTGTTLVALGKQVGVKPTVLRKTLERLACRRIVQWDGQVIRTDGTYPTHATPAMIEHGWRR